MYLPCAVVCGVLLASASAYVTENGGGRLRTDLYGRKPFITGNWKLNPQTKQEAIALANGVSNAVSPYSPADVAIFVPFPFIEAVQACVGNKCIVGAEVRVPTKQLAGLLVSFL